MTAEIIPAEIIPAELGPEDHARTRSRSTSVKEMRRDARLERLLGDPEEAAELREIIKRHDAEAPKTRAECAPGSALRPKGEPCSFFRCRHNLYLDVDPVSGSVKFNFPDKEFWELEETCALDVADKGGDLTLEQVGGLVNLTRERVRQIEVKAGEAARQAAQHLAPDMLPEFPSERRDDAERREVERAWMLQRLEPFTATEAIVCLGRSYGFVLEVARELVAQGLLVQMEDTENVATFGKPSHAEPPQPTRETSPELLEQLHQRATRSTRGARVEREIPHVPSHVEQVVAAAAVIPAAPPTTTEEQPMAAVSDRRNEIVEFAKQRADNSWRRKEAQEWLKARGDDAPADAVAYVLQQMQAEGLLIARGNTNARRYQLNQGAPGAEPVRPAEPPAKRTPKPVAQPIEALLLQLEDLGVDELLRLGGAIEERLAAKEQALAEQLESLRARRASKTQEAA
jgi:hypothetical protein